MILYEDAQGSPGWLAARAGVITGSCFCKARAFTKAGKSSAERTTYARDVARSRCTGLPIPSPFQTAAMLFGIEQEPAAKREFEVRTGEIVSPAGFITTDDRRFGVSVDGLIGDDGGIEVKTIVGTDQMFKVLVERDLSDYADQCLGAMWLLGRRWWKLVLWAPDLAPIGRDLTVVHIARDETAIEALEADLVAFLRLVDENEAALRRLG